MGGSQSPLSLAHVDPSLEEDEVPFQGEDVEDTAAMRAVLGADGMAITPWRGPEGRMVTPSGSLSFVLRLRTLLPRHPVWRLKVQSSLNCGFW